MSSSTNNGYFNGTLGAATQSSAFVNSDVYHAKQGEGSFAREPTYGKTWTISSRLNLDWEYSLELLNYGQEACQNPNILEKTGNPSNIPASSPESAWNRSGGELGSSRRGVSPPFVSDPPFRHQHHDLGRTGDSDCTRDQLFHSIGDFVLTPEAHNPVEPMRAVPDERDSYLARTRNGQSCTQVFRPTFNTNVNPGQQFLNRGPTSHHHLVGTGQPMRFDRSPQQAEYGRLAWVQNSGNNHFIKPTPRIGDVPLEFQYRMEDRYSVAGDPYLTYRPASYNLQQLNHEKDMARSSAAISNVGRTAWAQLGGPSSSDTNTTPTPQRYPQIFIPEAFSCGSRTPPPYTSQLRQITNKDGSCNYRSPEGIACKQKAISQERNMARHWLTAHATVELERMLLGRNDSETMADKKEKQGSKGTGRKAVMPMKDHGPPLSWAKGAILNSEARVRVAEEYLSPCPECVKMGVPLHRHRFKRPDVLQRHLQDVHKMEKGQAKRTSKQLMLVSRLGSRGWVDAIQRILC